MMTIEFYDEEDTYGRIETEENPDRIEELLKEYKKTNPEEYNIDDFFLFLKERNVDFVQLNIEADRSIYF